MRFTLKAKRKALLFNNPTREALLERLMELCIGYINPNKNCEIIEEGPCANMVYFSTNIKGTESFIVFAIILDKIPIIKNKKVVQYRFNHYLKVIDVVKKNKDLRTCVDSFKNSIKGDPDK